MNKNPIIVVFPSKFSINRIDLLATNIKKILGVKAQNFSNIIIDGHVIRVDAHDPVIASSVIGLLFGIKKISIANVTDLKLDNIVQETERIASRLLLNGEKFLVKVDGKAPGYLPVDAEIAITTRIIQNHSRKNISPGTTSRFDKMLYVFLGNKAGYICLFTDQGLGGVPNGCHKSHILCCIYDELSAIATLGAIRDGYNARFLVCYRNDEELLKNVKMLDGILNRIPRDKNKIDFFRVNTVDENHLWDVALRILIRAAKKRKIVDVCVAMSPLINSSRDINRAVRFSSDAGLVTHMPLAGLDGDLQKCASEIGLEKFVKNIAPRAGSAMKGLPESKISDIIRSVNKCSVVVKTGPNQVHDILDSLGIER